MSEYSDVDVIAAQATPMNVRAPLAIIRVSGPGCHDILNRCFKSRGKQQPRPWRVCYGDWFDENGHLDDVMLSLFEAPKSYTGQDMFEVTCHGTPVITDALMRSLVENGVRRARPGEFTMRAVINGKMDLLQAEGVNALIESNTRYQADLVRRQAGGPMVPYIREQVEAILQIQAHIEATIDYGEEDIDALERDRLLERIATLLAAFQELKETARFANGMRRGFKVLITGEPNVGKSTLFNTLVRQERAIVTPLPGTTRDLISEEIEIGGLPIVLIDSAGVRDTEDMIEYIGIEKIFETLESVDLVLCLRPLGEPRPFHPRIAQLPEHKRLIVWTKADLAADQAGTGDSALVVSAETGLGLPQLEEEIVIRLSTDFEGRSVYLINQRQEELIADVVEQLALAFEIYQSGFGEEVLSSYLNTARRLLGELTGETGVEDILDRMFSNFCLGK